ncbi:MAG: type IV secretion system DNA-binding domain-containing protein [Candidatus Magasanikbacteria bacterium]|jgi:hypothetical protein|nr:type IV secretion system DNA-binding domain-containing protein [Candidatus Magasanikbacteria bacterium]
MPAPYLLKQDEAPAPDPNEICLFAQTNYRNQMRRFGIKIDDRRRHSYIIGKTGMGKSTMMENMMLSDIYNGHGVGLIDPHGDFAEKIIDYIPSWRMNDVIYVNPADLSNPIGFNILEVYNEEQKHLVAAGMMGTFKKIWPDVWSSRMEYILNNTLLVLLDNPGTTLLGINRLLSDKKYRRKLIKGTNDPVVKSFWQIEFAGYSEKYATEAVAPIQNKIGQFLSASLIRNMVAQPKSTFDVRKAMDDGKILIMNLSKGRMGEDNSRLLGGMLITKLQLSAMERVDMLEKDRRDFFLYVDEFQNFATPSFANILSEARKYHLGLIMAHQYVAQLDEVVADAVFGNVGTIISFRVGASDAESLAKEYAPIFMEEDIVNLAKYQILLKLMIDGVASQPFSALTLPPIGSPTGSAEKVIRVSRERYGRKRAEIEEKIMRWSGFGDEKDEDVLPPIDKKKKDDRKRSSDNKRSDRSSDTKQSDRPSEKRRSDKPSDNRRSDRPSENKPRREETPRTEKKSTVENKPVAEKKPEPIAAVATPAPAPTPAKEEVFDAAEQPSALDVGKITPAPEAHVVIKPEVLEATEPLLWEEEPIVPVVKEMPVPPVVKEVPVVQEKLVVKDEPAISTAADVKEKIEVPKESPTPEIPAAKPVVPEILQETAEVAHAPAEASVPSASSPFIDENNPPKKKRKRRRRRKKKTGEGSGDMSQPSPQVEQAATPAAQPAVAPEKTSDGPTQLSPNNVIRFDS